jgi:hypothetical protein
VGEEVGVGLGVDVGWLGAVVVVGAVVGVVVAVGFWPGPCR